MQEQTLQTSKESVKDVNGGVAMISQEEWSRLKEQEQYGMYIDLDKRIRKIEQAIPWIDSSEQLRKAE